MKTCADFAYTGVDCCIGCHYENEDPELLYPLITIQINGEMVYVCCSIAYFFYPDGEWKDKSETGQWSNKNL